MKTMHPKIITKIGKYKRDLNCQKCGTQIGTIEDEVPITDEVYNKHAWCGGKEKCQSEL